MKQTSLLAIAIAIAMVGPLPVHAQQTCPTKGADAPPQLHETWILDGWEKRVGDDEFVFAKKLGRYYDLQAPGVYFDDLAPGQATMRTPASYGAMWEGPFNAMRSAQHGISDPVQAIIGDRVASTTLEFVAQLEAADGTVSAIFDRSQLGWECHADGRWVIRHESNSSRPAQVEEIEEFLPKPGD
jgi:ketosteroid isomerase-like protein